MGLFAAKASNLQLTRWLNAVDAEYNTALETLDVQRIATYLTKDLVYRVIESIRRSEKVYSGLSKYRHVTWKKESESSTEISVLKIVKYDHIKVTRGIIAPVGEDYTERWTLLKNHNPYLLAEMRRI